MRFHEYVKEYSVVAGVVFFVVIIGIIFLALISSGKKMSEFRASGSVLAVATVSGNFGNTNQILVEINEADKPLTVIVGDKYYRKSQVVNLHCNKYESKAISCRVQD